MSTRATTHLALTLGRNLREARETRELTQRQVGNAIGVTNRDVSRWEAGKVEPSLLRRIALADLLFDGEVAALYREPEDIAA